MNYDIILYIMAIILFIDLVIIYKFDIYLDFYVKIIIRFVKVN